MALKPVSSCNVPVTGFTFDLFFYVAFMVEHDMFGYIKNLFPRCGGLGIKVMVLFSDFRVVGNNKVVAIKTFFNRWDPGMDRPVHI